MKRRAGHLCVHSTPTMSFLRRNIGRALYAASTYRSGVCNVNSTLIAKAQVSSQPKSFIRSATQWKESTAETATAPSALRRAVWLRMDPVMKLTILVDLSRRAPALLNEESDNSGSNTSCVTTTHSESEPHRRHICRTTSYVSRLRITYSLAMWLRCLRDVQDTIARLHLPYAVAQRHREALVAKVFPTRLAEYCVDAHTQVFVKMHPTLNPTAEQIPAPHDWQPDVDVVNDDDNDAANIMQTPLSSSVPLTKVSSCTFSDQRRCLTATRLQRVQNCVPRPGCKDDDVTETCAAREYSQRGFTRRGERRSTLRIRQRARNSTGAYTVNRKRPDLCKPRPGVDSARKLDPPAFDTSCAEDAHYHNNQHRAEGCPLDDTGRTSVTPIDIDAAANVAIACDSEEQLVQRCVMAHAAVLSSLFIEGRTAWVTTNDDVVYSYLHWLFANLVAERFVTVERRGTTVKELEVKMPYYPSWSNRKVLLLIPPRSSHYAKKELCHLVNAIAQAAPCTVITEGDTCVQTSAKYTTTESAPVYVQQLQAEVARAIAFVTTNTLSNCTPSSRVVQWEHLQSDLLRRRTATPRSSARANATNGRAAFQPCVPAHCEDSSSTIVGHLVQVLLTFFGDDDDNAQAGWTNQHSTFLRDAGQAVELYYQLHVLYTPENTAVSWPKLQHWVWHELPASVRVVGVNASPLDLLFYFPQAPFLSQKVGNAFRFRTVERAVVYRHCSTIIDDPVRYLLRQRWLRLRSLECIGLQARPSFKLQDTHTSNAPQACAQDTVDALLYERAIDYLCSPNILTWLGLLLSKVVRL